MKKAFIFPGQGAQVAGMGKDIAEAYPEAAAIYKRADEVLGYEISKYCFEGPQEELNLTNISQPAIFVTSAAILEVVRTRTDASADVCAGLSLGEYSALYAAGMLSFEDALTLVQKRGEAMQKAADESNGTMVSVLNLDAEKIPEVLERAAQGEILVAANYNCPGQIVLSGEPDACRRAATVAEELGAMKTVELAVAGAFHSPLMQPAADALKEALENTQIAFAGAKAVIANYNADYYKSAEQVKDGLCVQLTGSVLWEKSMAALLEAGVEDFCEIGPGRVLTGLMRKIDRKTKVTNLSTADALAGFIGA